MHWNMEHIDSLKSEIAEYRFLIALNNRLRPLMKPGQITLAAAEFLGQ